MDRFNMKNRYGLLKRFNRSMFHPFVVNCRSKVGDLLGDIPFVNRTFLDNDVGMHLVIDGFLIDEREHRMRMENAIVS